MKVEAKPVLDGRRIKWTLEQQRTRNGGLVRIDWLRFTAPVEYLMEVERGSSFDVLQGLAEKPRDVRDLIRMCMSTDHALGYQSAKAVALSAAKLIGPVLGFEVGEAEDKGLDFYAARVPLIHEGLRVGWALAGAKSAKQAATWHVVLEGTACLFISQEKWVALRRLIDGARGWITRVDLALDLFEGYGPQGMRTAYLDGEFDVRGKRPTQDEAGKWTLGHSRTFYVGSRETGKYCRGYEKGDQLFGPEANDEWFRVEVEFRDNQRVIPTDVLDRPAEFFAGAYTYCARLLQEQAHEVEPAPIATQRQLLDATVHAATDRVVRWVDRVVSPALRVIWDHGGDDLLVGLLDRATGKLPRRLQGFNAPDIRDAIGKVAAGFAPPSAPLMVGA